MKNPKLEAAKKVARDKFAWPGGYPLVLVMADGGVLCPECVRAEWRSIVTYTKWGQRYSGWCAEGYSIEESPEEDVICDHCGKVVAESSK